MPEPYLRVEVGHFGKAGGIIHPAGIRDVKETTGSAIDGKIHEWARDVELLVNDLQRCKTDLHELERCG